MESSFHMSLPCLSVEDTKNFYTKNIGASLGRTNENWLCIIYFSHQRTFIEAEKFNFNSLNYVFEGKLLLSYLLFFIVTSEHWQELYAKLNSGNSNYFLKR